MNVIKYIQKYLLQHPRKAPSSYNQKHAEIWHKGRIAGFHEAIQWVLTWQYIPKDGVKRSDIKEYFSDEDSSDEDREKITCLHYDSQESMIEALIDEFPDHETENFYTLGEDYTRQFRHQFELFKYWAEHMRALESLSTGIISPVEEKKEE